MPQLQDIENDLKEAMRAQEKERLLALRNIKSFLKNKSIDAKRDLTEEEVLQALSTLAKQRRESIDAYQKAGRQDLLDKEKAELQVIENYLPAPLSTEELEQLIQSTIQAIGAQGMPDMGKVMKALKPKVTGRADGKIVSEQVRAALK